MSPAPTAGRLGSLGRPDTAQTAPSVTYLQAQTSSLPTGRQASADSGSESASGGSRRFAPSRGRTSVSAGGGILLDLRPRPDRTGFASTGAYRIRTTTARCGCDGLAQASGRIKQTVATGRLVTFALCRPAAAAPPQAPRWGTAALALRRETAGPGGSDLCRGF